MIIVAVIHIPEADSRIDPPERESLADAIAEATLQAVAKANPQAPVFDMVPEVSLAIKAVKHEPASSWE